MGMCVSGNSGDDERLGKAWPARSFRPAPMPRTSPVRAPPRLAAEAAGERFSYDDDGTNLLSVALTRAIRQSARTFAEQNLFGPLEITSFDWIADSDGYLIGADTLALTARDMVKIGLLYLQRGRWDNTQIVSSDYVAELHGEAQSRRRSVRRGLWLSLVVDADQDRSRRLRRGRIRQSADLRRAQA